MESHNSGMKKALPLVAAGLITASLALPLLACAKDETPPIIQQYEINEWLVEDENIDLTVKTFDDRAVKQVHIQFDGGATIHLERSHGQKNGREEAEWKASFQLPPDNYSYSIVAKDKMNETSKKGNIVIYPRDADDDGIFHRQEAELGTDPNKKNPVARYLLDKNLGIYIPTFAALEEDGMMDANEKGFIDLAIAYHHKLNQTLPGFYGEIMRLPDLSTIEGKDVEAVEDILMLAHSPEYGAAFQSMLSEGIKDKRKYCTPLEGLLWIAYDRDFDEDNPLDDYSLEQLINESWKNTSNSYKSEKWQEFEEVVDRLNSPELVSTYCIDSIPYDRKKMEAFMSTGRMQSLRTPQETFIDKTGACMDQSNFALYCLRRNGYGYDDFDLHESDAACRMSAGTGFGGHDTCLYVQDGEIYVIDAGTPWVRGIKGPVKTLEDAATITWAGWSMFMLWDFGDSNTKPRATKYVKK